MDNDLRKKSKYIQKNLYLEYEFEPNTKDDKIYNLAVVIPVFNELDFIAYTLSSLAENDYYYLNDTLILLVINNPENIDRNSEPFISNQQLLNLLRTNKILEKNKNLNLKWINASSPEKGLLKKGGVGAARKLGMDIVLNKLNWDNDPIIVCLDADTVVEHNYLKEISLFFAANRDIPGATVSFEHLRSENRKLDKAISDYEYYLRYYVAMLRFAGSPYDYYSIGSTIAVRAGDYIKVGGMRTNEAGEDFYFLQALRKLGRIPEITKTKVYQSSRISDRVPFGTGASMERLYDTEIKIYNPCSFKILKEFLFEVKRWLSDCDVYSSSSLLINIPNEARMFLEKYEFAKIWTRILNNTIKNNVKIIDNVSRKKLVSCFNIWFDAFKTLKFIHFLEREYPDRFPKIKIDKQKNYDEYTSIND